MIKIRIAHISDIHQGTTYNPPSRFQDIEKILDWAADKLITENVDICLVCGDLFKDAKVMFDRGTEETICIGNWLRKLSGAGIETIVISGTPSHDAVSGYKILKEIQIPMVDINIAPTWKQFIDYAENIVSIGILPGLNRSALMTQEEYKGLPPEHVHRIMTDKITQMCMGMAAQMPDDRPKILMAHMTYQGADTGFADLLMQHEPILTREAVSGFDLVCLGHIHRPQIIDSKVFYSGPIERLSFNDEGITPGFWIHEITDDLPYDRLVGSQFIETPARRYFSLKFDEGSIEGFNQHGIYFFGSSIANDIQNAIVRLHYSCSEETAKQLNRKALEKALYNAGCFYVAEIKADIQQADRARDVSVNESLSPLQALEKWCINQGIGESETKELVSMASGLLESEV